MKTIDDNKENVILINKADLLTTEREVPGLNSSKKKM